MKRDIILSVKRGAFRSDDPNAELADKEFAKLKPEVHKKFKHRCVYCGFHAKKHQDVHHLDNDHNNNTIENLVTSCPLCHMCHHISFAGLKDMGTLIYIEPEFGVTQAELNALVRNIWFAEDSKNQEINSIAVELYFRLFFRSTIIKNALGDASPAALGEFLLSLDDDAYAMRKKRLEGVYFLPSKSGFARQYKYWRESYKGALPRDWKKVSIQNMLKWYNIENNVSDVGQKTAIRAMLEK